MPTKKARPAARSRAASHAPRQVRIIGGQWKRTLLPVPDAEGLRPTPDRVRETVFNWLHHLLDGNWQQAACLDLFAGSGALAFEAASRGAAKVVLVEAERQALRRLEDTRNKLKAQQVVLIQGDAADSAQRMAARGERFHVIFLDPPYHQEWLPRVLPLCERLLAEAGLVYVECELPLQSPAAPDWLLGWEVVRADKAGMVYYHLLQRNSSSGIQA